MDAMPAWVEPVTQAMCTAQDHQPVAGPLLAPFPAVPSAAPTDSPEPHIGAPECFAGEPASRGAFITNCSIIFSATEAAKVANAITNLNSSLLVCRKWKSGKRKSGNACLFPVPGIGQGHA